MEAKKSSIQGNYMLGRGFRESARLHIQHWMWQYRLGYLLHPSITKGSDMRVIDIGAGNACWLLDLAHQSPSTWQLQGVDVSKLQYPANEYLPKNVSLKILDVFEKIPDDMIEKFDVVHVRAFGVVITHADPMPLLKNLVSMLKPGGYLQWDEFDIDTFRAHAPNQHTEKKHCDELLRIWHLFARKTNLDFGWVTKLPSSFQLSNLELVDTVRLPPVDALRKASTDNYMLGLEEIGAIAADRSTELLGSHEDFRDLMKNAVQETQQGVSLEINMVVLVGRKPTLDSSWAYDEDYGLCDDI